MHYTDLATVIDDLSGWAERAGREPLPSRAGLEVVLDALVGELGVTDLGALRAGMPTELLLDVCPGRVGSDDVDDVLTAARTVLDYAAESGHIPATLGRRLRREIDAAAAEFADAVLAEEVAAALDDASDDGDFSDEADDDVDEDVDDEDAGPELVEIFGTDRLPPLRLPPEPELAAAARASARLDRARALAMWAGEGRPVTEEGELGPRDAAAAVRALGITDDDAGAAELAQLWELADALGFVDLREHDAVAAETVNEWPDSDDETVLRIWRQALTEMMAWSMLTDTDRAADSTLDLSPAGSTVLTLFPAREHGVPLAALADMIHDMAIADQPAEPADAAWRAWVAAHGDPARVLYDRMSDLGAVEIDADDVVRLTPLGQYALWEEMRSEIEIPLLPQPRDMTAAQLVSVGTSGSDDQLAEEWRRWRAERAPHTAARELAEAAGAGGPDERIIVTSLLRDLGADADDAWHDLLDEPSLRPYAKQALSELHGSAPEFDPGVNDLAWLLLDLYCDVDEDDPPEDLGEALADAVRPGEETVFDAMARLDHPHRHTVLTLIGQHHPDEAMAKAARKASFRASGS